MGSLTQAWIQLRSVTYPIQQNSREHCIIECLNQKLEVTDLDSRNGTMLNGKRISVPTQLHHRDVINVGESQLTILLELDPDHRNTDSDVPLIP